MPKSFVKMSQVSQYISTQLAFGKAKKVEKVRLVQVGSDKERSKGWVGSGNARGRPGPKRDHFEINNIGISISWVGLVD